MVTVDADIQNLDDVTFADQTCLGGAEKEELKKIFESFLKANNVPEEKVKFVTGLFLYSSALRGTTNKGADDPTSIFLSLKLGEGKTYTLTYGELRNFLNSQPVLATKPNKLRFFCRTFQKEYLDFAKRYRSDLQPLARANRYGIPAEDHYLAADFLTTSPELTELQQGRLLLARENATKTESSYEPSVTSLKQLGRGLATSR
ncbi:CP [Carnation yellow fleck virus]|uniref:CP n=1 Tax=Carnation yellow fleck virus TaxID=940280 RepID=UPI0003C9D894|nr:CP [Carnation yellow fleck virus]ADV40943.1 CP [Carnation yellow fleck virus]